MKTLVTLTLLTAACSSPSVDAPADVPASPAAAPAAETPATPTSVTLVPASEVNWEQLNPARGDASPKAATLWGDRNGEAATGFLFNAIDGFESPPHIHNVSYRGVVIRGVVHNDDPEAGELWMPSGSFWTQPKGHVHITAARGSDVLAYIEIDEGPYLVRPVDQAFSGEEKPVNVDASNIVWLDAADVAWSPQAGDKGAQLATLWASPGEMSGALFRLPAGASGALPSRGETSRVVVIQGRPELRLPGEEQATSLEPGSYLSIKGGGNTPVSCGEGDCILYIRMEA